MFQLPTPTVDRFEVESPITADFEGRQFPSFD
jgi:hypothetical protein